MEVSMNNHPTLPAGPCRKILFCTDFSENAEFAFQFAVDAARRRPGCELYLLHVIPEVEAQFWKTYVYDAEDVDNKAKQDMDKRIQEAYLSRVPEGINIKVEYRLGNDWQEILDFAQQMKADLIVMGRQGRGALQKALFGNVTEKVVRKAECAVLVVPLSFQQRLKQEGRLGEV
jgi:nucleotide-binding universal stress UspA family protein